VNITMKYLSLMLLGSTLWLVCADVPGNSSTVADTSFVAKASNLVLTPAYADEDKHESAKKDEKADEREDEREDENKKDDDLLKKEGSSDHHDKKEHEKND